MAEPHEHEFLSLDDVRPPFSSDEDTGSSPFDTLWTEFARSRPTLSPPRTPTHRVVRPTASNASSILRTKPIVDLRSLDYLSEYDSNLMCPICHVPFIDPVVLDCDHTFCHDCFEEYRNGGPSTDRSKCPACRSYHLGGSRKASRLIKNMCNDIQVRCPNNDCDVVAARGYIEQHAARECAEQEIPCPDSNCSRKSKRKHFVPDQCIHSSHIECDCGASIRLGRGEWIKHKDSECPNTNTIYSASSEMVAPNNTNQEQNLKCPGADYGCTDETMPTDHENHVKSCPLARIAPAMRKQNQLLQSLTDQLKMANLRNEVLEMGFDRLSDLISTTIEPKLNHVTTMLDTDHDHDNASDMSDIEEIERNDLTPNHLFPPTTHIDTYNPSQHPTQSQTASSAYTTAYTSLHPRLSALETQTSALQSNLSDLDARSSMALMNETLRIREELAHINGAMYSTRAQIQWLLNRERILGQREAMGVRGRVGAPGAGVASGSGSAQAQGGGSAGSAGGDAAGATGIAQSAQPSTSAGAGTSTSTSALPSAQRPSVDRNMSSAWSTISQAIAGSASGPSSTATSPMFGAARPSLRRLSGSSSQERVKL